MRENKTCLDQGWSQLPTEELDQVLQAELEKDHPNEEVVLPILNELEEREKDYPVERTPEVLTILDQYSKHETTSKHSKYRRGWIAGIAALAAVVCIVVMAIPRTVGAESIFDVLFRWTDSFFEFVDIDKDKNKLQIGSGFVTSNSGLQQLYDKVTELGVSASVVPMWLPDGLNLSELKEMHTSDGKKVFCKFEKRSIGVTITYRISNEITTVFEKENTGVEVFEFSGVNHFIVDNGDNYSVMWMIDGAECSIFADVSKEDVYKVIKSIYRSN